MEHDGSEQRTQAEEECAKSSTVKATEKRSLDEKPYGIKDDSFCIRKWLVIVEGIDYVVRLKPKGS